MSLSIQGFLEIHRSSATDTVLTHYMKIVSSLQNILHSMYYYFLKNGSFYFNSEFEYIVCHDGETLMAGALRDLVLLPQYLRSRVRQAEAEVLSLPFPFFFLFPFIFLFIPMYPGTGIMLPTVWWIFSLLLIKYKIAGMSLADIF